MQIIEILASIRDRIRAALVLFRPGAKSLRMARTVSGNRFVTTGLITSYWLPQEDEKILDSAWSGVDLTYRTSHYHALLSRIRTVTYLVGLAEKVPGDLVELGVFWGIMPRAYLAKGLAKSKSVWLFDLWGDKEIFRKNPWLPKGSSGIYEQDIYNSVKQRFSEFANVHLIRGLVPNTLDALSNKSISYLSLDMNSVEPEIAALSRLWDKISVGGVVYLDDYGDPSSEAHRNSVNLFMESKGQRVFSLDNGLAFVIKQEN